MTGVESQGHFAGVGGSSLSNAPIPHLCLPKEWRDQVKTVDFREGVAAYEDLVRSPDADAFKVPWPADITAIVGRRIYKYMNCISAWQVIPRSAFVGLLDTVRNRVLNFALEIEAASPAAGDAPVGEPVLSVDRVNQVFNTVIMGGTNTIAAGGSVQVNNGVRPDDLQSLVAYMQTLGAGGDDTTALERAVRSDSKPTTEDRFGPEVSKWLGAMVSKAASGAWKIGSTVASEVLSKALLKYYGL